MWNRIVAAFARLGFAWARIRLDEESRRELHEHLDHLTDRYARTGMSREEAKAAAWRQFGNPTLTREKIYTMNGIAWIDVLSQDLRYGVRQLRHSPAFAAVVVATLALGIGGTTAVFSVVHAVLLSPLPYEQPGQLVRVHQQEPGKPSNRDLVTGAHFTMLREVAASFDDVAAIDNYSERGLDLFKDGRAQRLRVLPVTSDYFRTLRAALLGPGFTRDDENSRLRIVLSDALWRARFGGDPAIVGTIVQLSAESYEIAGVAPPDFEDPIAGPIDAWVPYNLARDTSEHNTSLNVVGRLRNGVTLDQASAELVTVSRSMRERWPGVRTSAVAAVALQEAVVGRSRGPLRLLLLAVGLLLLVACVNVANLVLVRATGRVHEFAIRAALGSGHSRLLGQLLVESLLLAALGGLLGLMLAAFGVRALRHLGRGALPRLDETGFDPVVLAFAAAVTVATAIGFGIAPALRLARIAPSDALRRQSRSATATRAQVRLRSALAAAQLAAAVTLLAAAGVLLASFHRLQSVPLGFRVERVLTFEVNLPSIRYDDTRRATFQEELARRLRRIPGVTAAGGTSRLPATGNYHPWTARIDSGPNTGTVINGPRGFRLQNRTVSGDFFAALDIPLLAGRTFDDRDDAAAPGRAVVSETFARHGFSGMPLDAVVGQHFTVLGSYKRVIIGVVGDVALDVYGAPTDGVYHAHRQFARNRNWALTHVVATDVPPEAVLAAVRAEVAAMDPELVVHRPMPMSEVVGRGVARERFALILMASFAGVALLLAVLGLYGVLAYTVRQRTQEIGIRIALGATAGQVRAMVLRQAAGVLVIGLAAGIAGALILGRWLSAMVFQVSPTDARILFATALVLSCASLISAWLPARRAARLEPRITMQES